MTMTEAAQEARRAYKRKWARENPDKIRAQQERYWNRKAAEMAANDPKPFDEAPGSAKAV